MDDEQAGLTREEYGEAGLKGQYSGTVEQVATLQTLSKPTPLDTRSVSDTSSHVQLPVRSSPVSLGLHIKTNLGEAAATRMRSTPSILETPASREVSSTHGSPPSPAAFPIIGSALRTTMSTSSMASAGSAASASTLGSAYLANMSDLTPLPSPIGPSDRYGLRIWRSSSARSSSQPRSRTSSMDDPRSFSNQLSPTSPAKMKAYGNLLQGAVEASVANAVSAAAQVSTNKERHTRNRSVSDFVPEQLQNFRHRHVTFGPGDGASMEAQEYHMQREAYLAAKKGLTKSADPVPQLQTPTPPLSTGDGEEIDEEEPHLEDGTPAEYLEIHCGLKNKRRKFRQLRQLGQGTFSRVMLATSERIPAHPTPEIEEHLDSNRLVAVKIVEHGPAGGADEERIETSLKREVEMLKSVSHPSLVHLKACEYQPSRALLVLTYCPGGDLFELASHNRKILHPPLVQRIFSELVGAVRHLHKNWIVHRDIKLENVLVNTRDLENLADPTTHPTPLITLTDLGLSRRVPEPPASPLLQTRCGSEDYAAPEILLGQPYDGRQTDAWALGVLLYALMEGRLPFDAPPGKPDRSRNTHRIARCDWIWCRFGDEDGEWDYSRPQAVEYEGARPVVEGLLKKIRMGRLALEDVEGMEWVRNGIRVDGGLRSREEDVDGDGSLL